jgi:predicted nucleotidyltransferase
MDVYVVNSQQHNRKNDSVTMENIKIIHSILLREKKNLKKSIKSISSLLNTCNAYGISLSSSNNSSSINISNNVQIWNSIDMNISEMINQVCTSAQSFCQVTNGACDYVKAILLKNGFVEDVYAFGSSVTGLQIHDSDIDMMVKLTSSNMLTQNNVNTNLLNHADDMASELSDMPSNGLFTKANALAVSDISDVLSCERNRIQNILESTPQVVNEDDKVEVDTTINQNSNKEECITASDNIKPLGEKKGNKKKKSQTKLANRLATQNNEVQAALSMVTSGEIFIENIKRKCHNQSDINLNSDTSQCSAGATQKTILNNNSTNVHDEEEKQQKLVIKKIEKVLRYINYMYAAWVMLYYLIFCCYIFFQAK